MKLRKQLYIPVLLLVTTLLLRCTAPEAKTTLIQNATIVDGSGADRFTGSLRVQDDQIVGIGSLSAKSSDTIIDGTGLVLSPGFIDTHSHHDWDTSRTVNAAISQGITTIIVGQDGRSQLPLSTYYDSLRAFPLSVNLGSYLGHGTVRAKVMGEDYQRAASASEIEAMKLLVQDEIQGGALGLSTGLEYDPGIYSTTEEVIALAKIVAQFEGQYMSHMRSEDVHLERSIQEIIQIGKEANIPVQISHFKLARKSLWGQAAKLLQTLDSARAEGVDITADIYPYQYWQSTMTVLFPKRDFDNRESAAFALTELTSPEGMIISHFNANPAYEGLSLDSIARLRDEDVVTTYLTLIKLSQETPGESIIAKSMNGGDIVEIMQWPYSNICSDGAPKGHPRGWGAFPRYLAMDTGQDLEAKIHKVSFQAAQNLALDSVGLIKEGYYADLILFDPKIIKDNATYEQSNLRASGIEMVMVSGKIVYKDQSPTGNYPGRILKGN